MFISRHRVRLWPMNCTALGYSVDFMGLARLKPVLVWTSQHYQPTSGKLPDVLCPHRDWSIPGSLVFLMDLEAELERARVAGWGGLPDLATASRQPWRPDRAIPAKPHAGFFGTRIEAQPHGSSALTNVSMQIR